jgi:hypothetical protein
MKEMDMKMEFHYDKNIFFSFVFDFLQKLQKERNSLLYEKPDLRKQGFSK